MVEFALLLPVLVLLVVGMIEFGKAYNAQINLTGAAREGARVMAIHNDTARAEAAVAAAATGFVSPTTVVEPSDCSSGDDVTVTVTAPIDINVPFFGSPSIDLRGVGVMRCGG